MFSRRIYIDMCIQNIENNSNIVKSIWLMTKIFEESDESSCLGEEPDCLDDVSKYIITIFIIIIFRGKIYLFVLVFDCFKRLEFKTELKFKLQ